MKEKTDRFIRSNFLVGIYLVLIVFTLLYIFCYGQSVGRSTLFSSNKAHIVDVIDGDTVEILSGKKVRLLSINAPESGNPYSVEAREKLESLIKGKDVLLKFDQEKQDYYGRLLAYIYYNNQFINQIMVKEGLAYSYIVPPNDSFEYEIELSELEAKQSRIGIWSGLR